MGVCNGVLLLHGVMSPSALVCANQRSDCSVCVCVCVCERVCFGGERGVCSTMYVSLFFSCRAACRVSILCAK